MASDKQTPPIGWHAADQSLACLWDPDAPLPPALLDALRLRFPGAPDAAAVADHGAVGQPPPWLAAFAPAVVECFVRYAEPGYARADHADALALAPHLIALARSVEDLARAGAGDALAPTLHQARGCLVRVLYGAGRYAEGWAFSEGLPSALAAYLGTADQRAAWVVHGLLATEVGQHEAAEAALTHAAGLSQPRSPSTLTDWQLALGRADLAAARGQHQAALTAYAALAASPGPQWLRVRAAASEARLLASLGRLDGAQLPLDGARPLADGWCAGLLDQAAAELALARGQLAQAAESAAAARSAFAATLGEDHVEAVVALALEAEVAYARGAYTEAGRLSAVALPRLLAAYGPNNRRYVRALTLQALVAGLQGDAAALARDLARAHLAAQQLAAASSSAAVEAYVLECTLALARRQSGRARKAASQALELARASLDATHPLAIACLDALAECERAAGRWSVARVYSEMALALRETVFGPDHPQTATSWEQLGHVALDARDYRQARDAFELAVKFRRSALGGTHPLTATALLALARACVALGDLSRAQAAASGALGGFESAFGALHPRTRAARDLLGQFSSPLRRRWWWARAHLRRFHVVA